MDFSMEEYRKNVEILRKNKENVPLELLKTKYVKGYGDLVCRIKKQTEALVILQISAGMRIFKEDQEEFREVMNRIQSIIDKEKMTMKEIGSLVFSEYDIEKAMDLVAERIALPCFEQAYAPYFQSKCHQEGETFTCDLLPGMKWNQEHRVWIGQDGSFTLMLPPISDEREDK